ncbi:MAG: glycosyltransferase [Nitrospirota bacterium]
MKCTPIIVHFCPCYVDFDRETGGVANVVRQICLGLIERKMEVQIICGNRELGVKKSEPGVYRKKDGLTVHVISQRGHPLLGPVGSLKPLIKTITRPSIAHVHTCFSAFTEQAMAQLELERISFVFTPHGKLSDTFLDQHRREKMLWWRLWGRRAVSGASRIVLGSKGEASAFPQLGLTGGFSIVPNGFDAHLCEQARRIDSRLINEPYILYLGYLDPRKQPELLVRAFAVSESRKSHKLVIVGPDSYNHRAAVEEEIRRVGMGESVLLYGPAHGLEKWQLLSSATCFCLPSRGEGMPIALCEAVGAGLPLVISRECNFDEAFEAGAAIMPEDFDEIKWAKAIDQICLSSENRKHMAQNALNLSDKFKWENIVQQWIEVYNKVAIEERRNG